MINPLTATKEEIKSAIAAVNRDDVSQENVSYAKKLLRMTGYTFYQVLYLKRGIEHHSAWFKSKDRARQALNIVKGKGYRAIIYIG